MSMEDWVVVETSAPPPAAAPESKVTQSRVEATQLAAASVPPVTNCSPASDANLLSTNSTETSQPEQSAFGFNDVLKSVNDFQRASLGFYADQLQPRFQELKQVAANKSRWALDKARAETQRMLDTLSATEVSEYLARTNGEFRARICLAAVAEDYDGDATASDCEYDVSDLEENLGTRLVGVLCNARIPLFDGIDFKKWYTDAKPHIDSAIPQAEQTPEVVVCGVKLYSLPSVAATIDAITFPEHSARCDAVQLLTDYFHQRRVQTQKFYDLLQANIQS